MGLEKPYKNRIRLSLETTLGEHLAGRPAERDLVNRTAIAASWSPTSWLTLGALLPMVVIRSDAPNRETRHIIGLGDGELMLRALVFRDRRFSPRHTLGILLGLKAPTGPRVNDSTGYPADDDLQPGSGSWDGIFGANYAYFGALTSVFISASYRLTSPGYQGYRRGSAFGTSFSLQLPIGGRSALSLGMNLGYRAPDRLSDDILAPDTGGFLMAAAPGVLFVLRTDWLLRLSVQIPVVELWRGRQHETATGVLSLVVDI